ncbi:MULTISPECIES: c-type cytochrome [unclassified Halomonas]|jgi:cytochrome c553|uniref:c-type cytochrome n=1 Tax=unclassified Halomonas TaxID=2609666 RepID=UPI0002891A64|nr:MULTISPECIES: c-type cytochrome [unclassified Halomonas]MCE8036080.1 c-type cytochrome [Halomonas sp. MCCC 1A11062]
MVMKLASRAIAMLLISLSQAVWSGDTSSPALVGDAQRGADMAKLCTSCHGYQGRSVTSRYPSIAGMDEARFIAGMQSLRAGERGHLMASMTRGLSDQDIADLAAYYSRLAPQAQLEPHTQQEPRTEGADASVP